MIKKYKHNRYWLKKYIKEKYITYESPDNDSKFFRIIELISETTPSPKSQPKCTCILSGFANTTNLCQLQEHRDALYKDKSQPKTEKIDFAKWKSNRSMDIEIMIENKLNEIIDYINNSK